MSQRKIGPSWWVDITHQGVRYRKKSPENSKAGARAYETTLRRGFAEGLTMEGMGGNKESRQLFKDFAWFWFATYVEVHNKPSMVLKTKGILEKKLVPHFGNSPINGIPNLQVETYKSARVRQGLANKTINSELGVLHKCLSDGRRWFGLRKVPEIVKLKVPPVSFNFLTEEECELLLPALSDKWYDITYTALKTGLRVGELQALRWQDIDLNSKVLHVRHSRCSVTQELLSPKGNRFRSVPLTDDVTELLRKRVGGDEYVFGTEGQMFQGQTLNKKLAKACESVGLRRVTCHVLRHSYASILAMHGVPIVTIQYLLGHSDVKMTMRYAHVSQQAIDSVVNVMQKPFGRIPMKAKLVLPARNRSEVA